MAICRRPHSSSIRAATIFIRSSRRWRLPYRRARASPSIRSYAKCQLGAAALISEPWERKLRPQTGHEARYSLPIALAARLVDGAVTPTTFANVPSAEIVAKAECISARAMKGADFPARFEARLHVRFTNGSVTETYVDDVFGGARRPPTREAVLTKFRANAALTGNVDDVRMLEDDGPVNRAPADRRCHATIAQLSIR